MPSEFDSYALVAVPVPLGRAFSYAIPGDWSREPTAGQRVVCEFGRRKVVGVVLEVGREPPEGLSAEKVKPLLSLLDREPALPEELLAFLRELSTYYLAPIGEVLRLALPSLERSQLEPEEAAQAQAAGVRAIGALVQSAIFVRDLAPDEKAPPKARRVLEAICEAGQTPVTALEAEHKGARAAVKRLQELGAVRIELVSKSSDPFFGDVQRDEPPVLNERQQRALASIVAALDGRRAAGFLLEGVTGSGKTEVYLHAAAHCLDAGKSAIVLVPEIALTPQLVARFRARLGNRVAVLHSGLSELDRTRMWRRLRDGELRIAIGARSALFAPVTDLALVIVDEEHDSSFKQEEGVRYHGRDMALLRAHRASAVCVLGSATPSLSSEHLVRTRKLERLVLPDRAHHSATLPAIEIVDLRRTGPGPTGSPLLSLPLHRAIEKVLNEQRQAILFLNRRGFAPSLVCESCGKVSSCPNCSVALTAHRSGRQRLCCHYCDYTAFARPACASCGSQELSEEGAGTERIEELLARGFPGARVARLDRDVARGLESEKVLARMRAGEVDLLVGTQMVTKGHDLPNVTLVGVLNADAALSMPDFQAAERTFQLLVQVAGRAGRRDEPGRVLIQTRTPEHPAIRHALNHDQRAFAEQELLQRREARYPPFVRLLMIKIDSLDERLARAAAERLAKAATKHASSGVEVLGPSPAPLSRLRNRYRFRFLLRAGTRRPLYETARRVVDFQVDHRVRVQIDVDPVSML